MTSFMIRETNWAADGEKLRQVREAVFMREQGVSAELEWDEFDRDALHLLAEDNAGQPIATARLLADGHIGRMAVMPAWRGKGIGKAVLLRLLDIARQRNLQQVALNAQTQAAGFYAKYGFHIEGGEFLDAGIPHLKMRCFLK